MTEREKLIKEISDTCRYKHDDAVSPYKVADFIIADRKAVLDSINKALTQLHEEAHDGLKDDYCYIHEIDAAFSEIDRAINTPGK